MPLARSLNRSNGHRRDTFPPAGKPELLIRGRLDAHGGCTYGERPGDDRLHFGCVRSNPRRLRDDGRIDIDNAIPGISHQSGRALEQRHAADAPVLLI